MFEKSRTKSLLARLSFTPTATARNAGYIFMFYYENDSWQHEDDARILLRSLVDQIICRSRVKRSLPDALILPKLSIQFLEKADFELLMHRREFFSDLGQSIKAANSLIYATSLSLYFGRFLYSPHVIKALFALLLYICQDVNYLTEADFRVLKQSKSDLIGEMVEAAMPKLRTVPKNATSVEVQGFLKQIVERYDNRIGRHYPWHFNYRSPLDFYLLMSTGVAE